MNTINVNVGVNIYKIKATLPLLYAKHGEALIRCAHEMGAYIETAGKSRCPVDTGHLRDSIQAVPSPTGVVVGASADYAAIVHERPGAGSHYLSIPAIEAYNIYFKQLYRTLTGGV